MDRESILPYIERKLVTEQFHPDDSRIAIYNYTQKCQFDKAWDAVTERCRGLILNVESGEIVANPFPKFFNLGERDVQLPSERPIITEKMDGSLGILYWLGDTPHVATRGSFTSDQALWATDWLRRKAALGEFVRSNTYLFEIIYPENRIVCNYDFSGLVLLSVRDTATGREIGRAGTPGGLRRVKHVNHSDIATLKDLARDNAEGFVIHYPQADLRLKVKFDEYVRLHRIMTGVNSRRIWEVMSRGESLDSFLENVPDEFYNWIREEEHKLRSAFEKMVFETSAAYVESRRLAFSRKDFADSVRVHHPELAPILFAMEDKKPTHMINEIIWKKLRPAHSTPFKVEA